MELLALIAPYFFWAILIVLGSMLIAYTGVLVYDELTSRTNDLYELVLTTAVAIEFLFRGRPKSNTPYNGRHRLEDRFIDDLYDEMVVRPGSLCYNEKLAVSLRM